VGNGRIEATCRSLAGGGGIVAARRGPRLPDAATIVTVLTSVAAAAAAGLAAAALATAGSSTFLIAAAVLAAIAAGLAAATAVAPSHRRGTAMQRRAAAAADAPAALDALTASVFPTGERLVLHAGDATVVAATAAAGRMAGLPAAGLIGDALIGRIAPGDRPAYLRALAETVATGRPAATTVGLDGAADGDGGDAVASSERGGSVFDVRFEAAAGGVLARFAPAGERLAAAAQIRRLTVALEAEEGLRERLVATLCHEIRTPLNAILGFAEALGATAAGGGAPHRPERVQEYAGLIGEAGRHLLAVTTDLLDAARLGGEAGHAPEPIDLAVVADRCRRMMVPAAEAAGLVLDLVVAPGLPAVHADPRACRQILLNLVSNAVKFTDRGGDVVISLAREGGRVRLSVRDTGIGIAAEAIGRLGTPYLRLDAAGRRRDGVGLGLAVVKALAAQHGGRLDIRSRPGRGTTASVDLPVADLPVPATVPASHRVIDGRTAG